MVTHFTNRPEAAIPTQSFGGLNGSCRAKAMEPKQRCDMATRVLGGKESTSHAARDNQVSRKFVDKQVAKAKEALDEAFAPPPNTPDDFLFWLPVTKFWIRQTTLSLGLTCRGSERGIVQFFDECFNYSISPGTVHNIFVSAVATARAHNASVDISKIRIAAFDEIFQANKPILVGSDVVSTYCLLLSPEEHRDADTWGIRILELMDRGFNPEALIADFGTGLRGGVAEALPDRPCRGDVFHAFMNLNRAIQILENRAYHAIEHRSNLQKKQAKQSRRSGRLDPALARRIVKAQREEREALTLAAEVKMLAGWLSHDILAVAGPAYHDRQTLFDFVVAELRPRLDRGGDFCERVGGLLANHRDELLAFAEQLDRELATLAQRFDVQPALLRELLGHLTANPNHPDYWQREAQFHQRTHGRLYEIKQAVENLHRQTVRASSVIENFNSRLRTYFSLRRHLGSDYLELLQFYINHRCFPRSDRPERTGKSPRELLTGQEHPHWLDLLGYTRFQRN
jgi:hypothetical protein